MFLGKRSRADSPKMQQQRQQKDRMKKKATPALRKKKAEKVSEITRVSLKISPQLPVDWINRDGRAYNIAASHVKAVANKGLGEAVAACSLRSSESQEIEDVMVSASLDGIARCDILKSDRYLSHC